MPLARKLNNQKLIDELNDLGMKYVKSFNSDTTDSVVTELKLTNKTNSIIM